MIITWAKLQQAAGKLDPINFMYQVFICLKGLGSSQLADHLVNEINQGPCYVNERIHERIHWTLLAVKKKIERNEMLKMKV